MSLSPDVVEIINNVLAGVAASMAAASLFGAFKSGVLRKIKFGGIELEASPKEKDEARALIDVISRPEKEPVPFETEQLAQYYSQVLAQSKISFWFSLIFASMGFMVIVVAGFMYSSTASGATVAQFIAGIVMDAVAALFFVQSKNAQASMGEFFDKLRRDRQQVESRKLCEIISDAKAKDALRIQLALHYAELPNSDEVAKSIFQACFPSADVRSPTSHSTGPVQKAAQSG